ncbi:hypothetical protein DSO57_1037146 [Entomophthora muscae]|uniref:Uncharacterized protein n=1 Tax=Entomophthora muscae TaxID=34485 RepID=A0ACC2TB07_9FUNG|nr:hypothetical protein DSO57_1037146 [Entomophthora muscae]
MILYALVLSSVCVGIPTSYDLTPTSASTATTAYTTSIPLLGGAINNIGYTVNSTPGSSSISFNSTLAGTSGGNTFNYGTSANMTSAISANGTYTPNNSQTMTQSQINSQVAASVQNKAVLNFGATNVTLGSGNTYTNAVSYSTLTTASHSIVTSVPGV